MDKEGVEQIWERKMKEKQEKKVIKTLTILTIVEKLAER